MKASEKLSAAEVRRANRNRVYMYLYAQDTPKTKRDIEQDLKISMPTVTQNLRELLFEGLIAYVGMEQSTGGRKARQIATNPQARFAIGIELSSNALRYVAVDLRAQEIAFSEIPVRFENSDRFFLLLSDQLETFLDAFQLERSKLLGVGITLPGIIDEKEGMIAAAPTLGVRNFPLSRMTEGIPYPCIVQNDASAGGMAELWRSRIDGDMAYLYLGKGVGGSIQMGGRNYRGAHGRSAEFGHTCVMPGGRLCSCGKHGCLEAYCSTLRLTEDTGRTMAGFFEGLAQSDPQCLAVWKEYLDFLALGIHNIRMTLDCDVLLGGEAAAFMTEYLPDLELRLQRLDAFELSPFCLRIGKCGSKAGSIGVALQFIRQFIEQV